MLMTYRHIIQFSARSLTCLTQTMQTHIIQFLQEMFEMRLHCLQVGKYDVYEVHGEKVVHKHALVCSFTATSKPTATPATALNPMALIMARLAALEAFLTKSVNSAKPPPKQQTTKTLVRTVKSNTKPMRRNRERPRQGIKNFKDTFAAFLHSGTLQRDRSRQRAAGARLTGRQGEVTREAERDRQAHIRRKIRPTTTTPVPFEHHEPFQDWYETSTRPYDVAQHADYPAAMDQLFATASDKTAKTKRWRMKNSGRAAGGRWKGQSRQMKQRRLPGRKQQSPVDKTGFQLLRNNVIQSDPFGSDPVIDQITAKVAARISNSISKKLIAAEKTTQKYDKNYAVNVIGGLIPGSGEEGAQKMNMTVQGDKKSNKVTTKGKANTSVTTDQPKPSIKGKATGKEKPNTTTTTTTETNTEGSTAAPRPPPMMYQPPWPYGHPEVTPPSESEYAPYPQYAYPPPMYPYPHGYPQQPPPRQENGNHTPYPSYPPPGYAPYPMYPMHGRYPGQWGRPPST